MISLPYNLPILKLLLVLTAAFASNFAYADTLIAQSQSPFGRVFVVDVASTGERVLRFGDPQGADQSAILLKRPRYAPVDYVRVLTAGIAIPPMSEKALVIGMGGGLLSNMLLLVHPTLRLESVEIDPIVVSYARKFFGLKEPSRHAVTVDDGYAFVTKAQAHDIRFDYIILDAYAGDDIPPALATKDFFKKALGRLTKKGVLGVNLALEDETEEGLFFQRLRALSSRCRFVRTEGGNLVVFLGGSPRALLRAKRLDKGKALEFSLLQELQALRPCAQGLAYSFEQSL